MPDRIVRCEAVKTTLDNPAGVPTPPSAYSHVARIELGDGALLVLSGQIALDDEGNLVGGDDMTAQSERIFEIVRGILDAHGGTLDDVVNIRTFLTDIDRLPEYGAVRRKYFSTSRPPTSTTVEVSRLFRDGALLEVEVVATVA
jgi:2-iminobutanoate/2-iminopropanoate deaminase